MTEFFSARSAALVIGFAVSLGCGDLGSSHSPSGSAAGAGAAGANSKSGGAAGTQEGGATNNTTPGSAGDGGIRALTCWEVVDCLADCFNASPKSSQICKNNCIALGTPKAQKLLRDIDTCDYNCQVLPRPDQCFIENCEPLIEQCQWDGNEHATR